MTSSLQKTTWKCYGMNIEMSLQAHVLNFWIPVKGVILEGGRAKVGEVGYG